MDDWRNITLFINLRSISPSLETSQLICIENQLTVFFIMEKLAYNVLVLNLDPKY